MWMLESKVPLQLQEAMSANEEKNQGAKISEISGWIARVKMKMAIMLSTRATMYPIMRNEAKSKAHYHDHAVAYYSQAADKIKGMSRLLLIL
jgi:hypothetical protein